MKGMSCCIEVGGCCIRSPKGPCALHLWKLLTGQGPEQPDGNTNVKFACFEQVDDLQRLLSSPIMILLFTDFF